MSKKKIIIVALIVSIFLVGTILLMNREHEVSSRSSTSVERAGEFYKNMDIK